MRLELVARKTDRLDSSLLELGLELGDLSELSGADLSALLALLVRKRVEHRTGVKSLRVGKASAHGYRSGGTARAYAGWEKRTAQDSPIHW